MKGLKKIVVELERADLKSVHVAAFMCARSTHNHPRVGVDCIKVVARWSCQQFNTIFIFRTLPSSVIPVLQLVATADSLPHLHHQVCHVLPLLVWVLLVIVFFRYLPGLPFVVLLLAALDPASGMSMLTSL